MLRAVTLSVTKALQPGHGWRATLLSPACHPHTPRTRAHLAKKLFIFLTTASQQGISKGRQFSNRPLEAAMGQPVLTSVETIPETIPET